MKSKLARRHYRFSLLDGIVALLLAALVALFLHRARAGLDYQWDWGAIPQFLFRRDAEGGWTANVLVTGFLTTLRLSVWGTILALAIGVAMGFARVSRRLFNRTIAGIYVELIRNIPPLVLVLIFFYFISGQIMPLLDVDGFVRSRSESTQALIAALFAPPRQFSTFLAGLVSLALFEGAYITEIVRSGIQSVERGQWEAAAALGLSRGQQMRHIIVPQAARIVLPPLAGQFISTIKDSAIVSIISIQDLTFQGMELMAATRLTFEIWITVTLLYLVLTLTLSLAVSRLEVYMDRKARARRRRGSGVVTASSV